MNILVYGQPRNEKTRELARAVAQGGQDNTIELCGAYEQLYARLLPGKTYFHVVAVLASDNRELALLQDLGSLLYSRGLVLILPDQGRETVSLGHKLRPTYMIDQYQDMREISDLIAHLSQPARSPLLQGSGHNGDERRAG